MPSLAGTLSPAGGLQCPRGRLWSSSSSSTSTSTSICTSSSTNTDNHRCSCSADGVARSIAVEGCWDHLRRTHSLRGLASVQESRREPEKALSRPLAASTCVSSTPMRAKIAAGRGSTRSSAAPADTGTQATAEALSRQQVDDQLSMRPLDLDPCGYFIIFVDREASQIVAQHFRNVIDARGLACDPETGEVIPCDGSYKPAPTREFRGSSAKQLSVAIVEQQPEGAPLVSMLSHANYLGRELQKAEAALEQGWEYVQD